MTGVYLSVLMVALLWAAVNKRDFFGPIRLYVMVYGLALGINALNLSRMQTPWSTSTNLLFWGSAFLFIGSGVIVFLLDKVHAGKEFEFETFRERLRIDSESINWFWFGGVFYFCSAVYIFSYFGSAVISNCIPLLAQNADRARIAFFGASLPTNIGLFFGPLSLMLGIEIFLVGKITKAAKVWVILLMMFVFALYMTIAMRLDLFRFFVFGLLFYHYARRSLGLKQLALAFMVGVVIFVGVYLARVHANAIGELNEMAKVKMPKKYMWASQIYAYVASNFWNMDYGFTRYAEELGGYPYSWGFELFRPFMFLLQIEGGMQSSFGFDSIFNDSIILVKGMNSTVYPWHFYQDFGAFGVYFLTLIAGLSLSIYYCNMRRCPSLFRVSLWGIFAGIVIFSLTAALWEFWYTYLNIAVLAIAHRKLKLL